MDPAGFAPARGAQLLNGFAFGRLRDDVGPGGASQRPGGASQRPGTWKQRGTGGIAPAGDESGGSAEGPTYRRRSEPAGDSYPTMEEPWQMPHGTLFRHVNDKTMCLRL